MRVVSWNVNGIRACVRHGFVDFVDRSGADIVGVQEVRARPEDIPPVARRWHTAFTVAERRGYSGVGLYSKLQPVRVDTSLGVPRFDREGRFMAGHFQTARGRFVVVNGYFPKGSGPDRDNSRVGYKLDFSRTVFARAQALRRRGPVLVIGRQVHVRTLQAAARTGRLAVTFSTRSVFGRPRRFATRAAVDAFLATHYRRFGGQAAGPAPLPEVPEDYDERLRALRRRLGLTQGALAERIAAAGKAVVYQWEARKRRPSPVFWMRIDQLRADADAAGHEARDTAPRP